MMEQCRWNKRKWKYDRKKEEKSLGPNTDGSSGGEKTGIARAAITQLLRAEHH